MRSVKTVIVCDTFSALSFEVPVRIQGRPVQVWRIESSPGSWVVDGIPEGGAFPAIHPQARTPDNLRLPGRALIQLERDYVADMQETPGLST